MAILEDYAKMIGDLIAEMDEARITDIASRMGVTHSTETKVVARLKREGLVVSRPCRGVFLSGEGQNSRPASVNTIAQWWIFLSQLACRRKRRKWMLRA